MLTKESLFRISRSKLLFQWNVLASPAWLAGFLLGGGVPKLPNVVTPDRGPMALVDHPNRTRTRRVQLGRRAIDSLKLTLQIVFNHILDSRVTAFLRRQLLSQPLIIFSQ